MEKKYFNNIKKRGTIYPYRFKTIDEMKNEYLNFVTVNQPEENITFESIGNGWRDYIDCYFSSSMDYLCGEDYEDEYLTIENGDNYRLPSYYQTFKISTQMLTENIVSPLYNMVSNKRKNIYENKVLKFNESKNESTDADSICVYIKDREKLFEFDKMVLETTGINQDLYNLYSNKPPLYFFVNLYNESIHWLSREEEDLNDSLGVKGRWYLNGVYKQVFDFEKDKEKIKNIIKNKKIDYMPYFLKSPKNVYESINTKPDFFKQTYYRLPNSEELNDINNHILTAKQVLDGFKYTIVGRGMITLKNKDMIIQSIEKLINIDENNMEYKLALKMAQK